MTLMEIANLALVLSGAFLFLVIAVWLCIFLIFSVRVDVEIGRPDDDDFDSRDPRGPRR